MRTSTAQLLGMKQGNLPEEPNRCQLQSLLHTSQCRAINQQGCQQIPDSYANSSQTTCRQSSDQNANSSQTYANKAQMPIKLRITCRQRQQALHINATKAELCTSIIVHLPTQHWSKVRLPTCDHPTFSYSTSLSSDSSLGLGVSSLLLNPGLGPVGLVTGAPLNWEAFSSKARL